jgi:hypothetical protein
MSYKIASTQVPAPLRAAALPGRRAGACCATVTSLFFPRFLDYLVRIRFTDEVVSDLMY